MSAAEVNTRIYVGNLPNDVVQSELEQEFERIGKLKSCELKKTISGAAFAFLEYEDANDAQEAIKDRDGVEFGGRILRVEAPIPSREGMNNRRDDRMRSDRFRNTGYAVIVSNLPPTGSWQDLKDLMREVGQVGHVSVFRGGVGEVCFFSKRDMEYAIDKFDGITFKSHEGEKSRISVREKRNSYRRSRSFSNRRRSSPYSRDRNFRHRSASIDRRRGRRYSRSRSGHYRR